jgi:hypothetical protein
MSEYTKAKTDKYGNATIGYVYWLEAEVRRLQAESRCACAKSTPGTWTTTASGWDSARLRGGIARED